MKHTPIVNLDHITVPVRDLRGARSFYEQALGALGMHVNARFRDAFGMGSKKQMVFWLARDREAVGDGHYAFRVEHRQEVDAFHAAALEAGGTDNGPPGLRPDYGRNYYAAFARDPEGNNIEVVCYTRPPPRARPRAGARTARPGARARRARR
jgi:catechol 2,3-dioxygenase-like lactoylglutathione lyase family enzyme